MQVTTIILLTCVALSECKMKPFVVDGGQADIHDFPYIAYLGIKCSEYDDDEIYFCGSSIINQLMTLTAAHCLFYCTENSSITVAAGQAHINGGVFSTAHSFLIHQHYSQQTVENDIALVSVTTAFIFSDSVSRVALMPKPPHNELARLAGWGLIDEQKEEATSNLLYTEQRVVELPQCEVLLSKIPNGTFCGSSTTLRGYASTGDSGSPLVVKKFIQIGIVSFKKPNVNRAMVIYTDTGYFYEWITSNVKKMICDINYT